jgi:hypothetical protein
MDRNLDSRGRISDLSFNIQLRPEEAVAHVIMYGAARMITWRLQSSWKGHRGYRPPFDPTQVPPPALATSLAEAQFWRSWHPFDAQLWGACIMNVETAAIG